MTGRSTPIAFYLPHLSFGGVERVSLNLAGGFAGLGYESHLVVGSAQGQMKNEVPPNVELVDLGAKRTLTAIPGIAKYLRTRRPRAFFSSKTHANVVAIAANLLAGQPTRQFVCEHSRHQLERPKSRRDRLALKLAAHLYRRADRVVAVAEDIAVACAGLTGIPVADIAVIPNPIVDPGMEARASEEVDAPWLVERATTILSVGRLVPEKDYVNLLEAFSRVTRSMEAQLVILGEGTERSRLEAVARKLGIADRVALPGYANNPLPIMRRADLFVLSSQSEGFPVVLVEALFCGCPVVATRCSRAIEEVLRDGALGELVPTGDPDALAEAILHSLQAVPDRGKLTQRAEDFSVQRIVREYEALVCY